MPDYSVKRIGKIVKGLLEAAPSKSLSLEDVRTGVSTALKDVSTILKLIVLF